SSPLPPPRTTLFPYTTLFRSQKRFPTSRENFDLADYLVIGELSLNGEIRPVRGALPLAVMARDSGLRGVILPKDNAAEAAVVSRSEEHTSELQSRENLVCRLL